MKACGNARCGVSTGYFGDELTFGRGELDDYGYWSIPCDPCARQWEREHPNDGECWPFADWCTSCEEEHRRTHCSCGADAGHWHEGYGCCGSSLCCQDLEVPHGE